MKTADGSPRRLAIARSSYVGLRTAPSTWSMRTRTSDMGRRSSDELLRGEELGQRRGARAVLVRDDLAGHARRAGGGVLDRGPRGVEADLARVDPDVAERPGLERLLLRRHDALERRVARLAGLVGDRQHQRQRATDDLGRGVAVALDADLVALRLDHRGQRDLRKVQALGEHRGDDSAGGVGRGHAAHHDVRCPGLLDRLREHERGGDVVGAGNRVVADVDALVGPHLQRLAHRVDGLLRTDGQRGDLGVLAELLLQLERLLHGVLVELREEPVDAHAVNGVVRLELPVGSGVGYVLHTDNNVHGGVAVTAPPVHSVCVARLLAGHPPWNGSHRWGQSQSRLGHIGYQGRTMRSRIRPTTSHAIAPRPQLNSAFFVSAFLPVNSLMPFCREKIPRSSLSAMSRTNFTRVLLWLASTATSSAPTARNSAASAQTSHSARASCTRTFVDAAFADAIFVDVV